MVVMQTIGIPETPKGTVVAGPYGVFSDVLTKSVYGIVNLNGDGELMCWSENKWQSVSDSSPIGIFIKTS